MMHPIAPMEPVFSDTVPVGEDWIAQIKWDGVRVLTYFDGMNVQLFNRKGRERTQHYPELTDIRSYCAAQSVILDGEVVALGKDGKPDFHEVMKRDGLRRMDRVKLVQPRVPIHYMIFDMLYFNGAWIVGEPLEKRTSLLREVIAPDEHVQLVNSHTETTGLYDVVKKHGLEGIVVKRLDAPYLIGQKRDLWRKVKYYRDLIAVVGGFTVNDAGVANALLLGLYTADGKFMYIGHAGTGRLSHTDWKSLTNFLKLHVKSTKSFVNTPERHKDALWVEPVLTVKVQYAEWTEGKSLRQPSIQAVVDVPPRDCVFEDTFLR